MHFSDEIIEEIVTNSNHRTPKSVRDTIYTGDIEIYENKDAFSEAGYDTSDLEKCIVLKNGYVVYFIGG